MPERDRSGGGNRSQSGTERDDRGRFTEEGSDRSSTGQDNRGQFTDEGSSRKREGGRSAGRSSTGNRNTGRKK